MSLSWSVNNEPRPGYVVSDDEAKAKAWIGRQTDASRYSYLHPGLIPTDYEKADFVLVVNRMRCAAVEDWTTRFPEAKLVFV